jgi:hypothetical protein
MQRKKMNTLSTLLTTTTLALLMTHTIQADPFDKTLSQDGISFHIYSENNTSLSKVTITPKGLKENNNPITVEADGTITGAEIGDINHDGSPEIYIYATSAGSGAYGSLIAYSANRNLSVSPIMLLPLEDDKVHSKGYMGHDSFKLEKDYLTRSFPVYKKEDSNAAPSGGVRTLKYTLTAGEATWVLSIIK